MKYAYAEKITKPILMAVCEAYGVTMKDMRSKSRNAYIVNVRRSYYSIALKTTDLTYKEVGMMVLRSGSSVFQALFYNTSAQDKKYFKQLTHEAQQILTKHLN